MAKYTRHKTRYPGVFFIEGKHVSTGEPEKVFYIRYRRDGQMVEEKAGRQFQDKMTPAKASKLRALRVDGDQKSNAERRAEKQAEIEAERGRWTIDRLWDEYKTQKPSGGGRVTDESRFARYIGPMFGNKAPDEIITLDVSRLRVKLLKKLSPQTVKHVLELLRRLVLFGVKQGLCPMPDPSRLTFELPSVDNLKTEDLSSDQLKALMKAIAEDSNHQVANLMRLALFTGMRRGELFKLEWRDIDFERGFITIRTPKGGKEQRIPMNDAARALLQEHERTGSNYVFPGRNGGQRVCCKKQVNRIKERAGLPKDFRALHGLRHTYASMLASSGKVDMHVLQKLLTHKSSSMTERYAHLRDEALHRASDVAGDLFGELQDVDSKKVVNLEEHRK